MLQKLDVPLADQTFQAKAVKELLLTQSSKYFLPHLILATQFLKLPFLAFLHCFHCFSQTALSAPLPAP